MKNIRKARHEDVVRLAEIEVFNYRINFYPIFQSDWYYFEELQVPQMMKRYEEDQSLLDRTLVYDDGVVKGFIRIAGKEVEKLFVEPVLQGNAIGAALLDYAIEKMGVNFLWALEKNQKAISFYERHGFQVIGERKPEDDTTEYLVRLERCVPDLGGDTDR